MLDFLARVLDSSDLAVRDQGGEWPAGLVVLHVVSDVLIWLAYSAIPISAIVLIRARRIPFRGLWWGLGLCIFLGGLVHLLEAFMFPQPVYRLSGLLKAMTALASWVAVISLVPRVPRLMQLRSREELQQEIDRRAEAERALSQANADLELRVQQRTEELVSADRALRHSEK